MTLNSIRDISPKGNVTTGLVRACCICTVYVVMYTYTVRKYTASLCACALACYRARKFAADRYTHLLRCKYRRAFCESTVAIWRLKRRNDETMSGDDEKQFPGESDEAWPEVFTKAPSMPTTLKPGQVSKEQLERFYSEVRDRKIINYKKKLFCLALAPFAGVPCRQRLVHAWRAAASAWWLGGNGRRAGPKVVQARKDQEWVERLHYLFDNRIITVLEWLCRTLQRTWPLQKIDDDRQRISRRQHSASQVWKNAKGTYIFYIDLFSR